ncbi:MAG: Hsp20 family protein [Alphaproteobacteria bacterium GM202ARS2]|nr:Hsp20 family protein [Alphaproteobacteria bacterium GM202ARS2]
MTRFFDSPLLLGFDHMERILGELAHLPQRDSGYPPFNIEQTEAGRFRITLAVAGFAAKDLKIWHEDQKLHVQGKHETGGNDVSGNGGTNNVVHRGIATRQFERVFVLADGMVVHGAHIENGLLSIDVERPPLEKRAQAVAIQEGAPPAALKAKKQRTIEAKA